MSEPTIKKPTKKAFHFPKSASTAPAEKAPAKKKAVASIPAVESTPVVEAPAKSATVKKSSKARSGPTIRTKPAKSSPPVKTKRAKKDKVVRDSFTMPKSDYEKIAALKLKCQQAGVAVKKSELLRAGLLMLDAASQKRLLAAVAAVEQVKTGRPANS